MALTMLIEGNCYDIILRATCYINPAFSFACIITLNLPPNIAAGGIFNTRQSKRAIF